MSHDMHPVAVDIDPPILRKKVLPVVIVLIYRSMDVPMTLE